VLHDLANDDGYVALRQAAEDREGWRHREKMSKTCYSRRLLMRFICNLSLTKASRGMKSLEVCVVSYKQATALHKLIGCLTVFVK